MLLHCDLVYAAESARFSLPFVDLGLCPEGGSSLLLSQRAGALLANELLMLGETFDATTALRAGIVNAAMPNGAVLAAAEETARILAAKPPVALGVAKSLIRRAEAARLAEQMDEEFARFDALLHGPEVAEALAAFNEKRRPDFPASCRRRADWHFPQRFFDARMCRDQGRRRAQQHNGGTTARASGRDMGPSCGGG